MQINPPWHMTGRPYFDREPIWIPSTAKSIIFRYLSTIHKGDVKDNDERVLCR